MVIVRGRINRQCFTTKAYTIGVNMVISQPLFGMIPLTENGKKKFKISMQSEAYTNRYTHVGEKLSLGESPRFLQIQLSRQY